MTALVLQDIASASPSVACQSHDYLLKRRLERRRPAQSQRALARRANA